MNTSWQRISAARPITWQFFAWMSLGMLVLAPSILVANSGGDPATWRGVFAVTLLFQGLLTLLLSMLVLRGRRIMDAPILSWSVMLVLSVSFPSLFLIVTRVIFAIDSFQPGILRFFTAVLLWLLGTLLFAVTTNETREFRSALGYLQAKLGQAQKMETEEQSHLAKLRRQVVEEIKSSLKRGFKKIAANASANMASTQLHSLIDEVVRPLATNLGERPASAEGDVDGALSQPESRVKVSALLTRLGESNPFDYKVMPVAIAFSTLFMKTWVASWQVAVIASFLSVPVSTIILFLLHKSFSRIRQHLGQTATVSFVFGALLCVALADAAFSRLVMGLEPSPIILALAFTEFGVLVLLAMLRVVPLERARLLAQIENAITQVNAMNARLGQLIRLEQKRLARLVHGDIQARMMATLLELGHRANDGEQVRTQIKELRESCESALLRPAQEGSLTSFLEHLRDIWAASIQFDVEISEEVVAFIESDPVAKDAVSEIVREAITNAAKHGRAKHVGIRATMSDSVTETYPSVPGMIQLAIANDGELLPGSRAERSFLASGQGTDTFEQLSAEWSLQGQDGQTTLTALVPVWAKQPVKD